MLGHTLVGLVDNVMVGQLGTAELAAVSLGNSFLFIAMSLGIGFSTAITPLTAEADASGDQHGGKNAFKHGLFLCLVLSVLLFLLMLVAKPLMTVMDQPAEVIVLARPYLDIVALSLIPLIIFQAFKQFGDGLSLTRLPMYATVLANIINVVLNYILIFGKLGMPKLGIIGAALGTLIARVIMLLFLWWLLARFSKSRFYVTGIRLFHLSKHMLNKVIALGVPSGLQMFFEVMIFTAAIWLSGLLGKNAQAANQIALNLSSMTFMVAMGLSVAAMIRVGNQKGLADFGALRRIAMSIFFLGMSFAFLFAILFYAFHGFLPTIYVNLDDVVNFADNTEVVAMASKLLIVAAVFQLSDSAQVILLGALRGLQDVKIPTLITFIAYWVIGFPVCYFLGKADAWGSVGIWIGLLLGLTSAALMLYIRFHYLTKRLIAHQSKTHETT